MKLSAKINLLTSAQFAILIIVINILIYITFSSLSYTNAMNTAEAELSKTAANINRLMGEVPETDLLRAYMPVNGMIQIVEQKNKGKSATSPSEQKLADRKPTYFSSEESRRIEYGGKLYAFQSIPIILPDGNVANLQLTSSLESVTEILRMLRLVLIVATLFALIPVVASSAFLGRLITRPVTSLTRTMSDIRQSGEFKRLTLEGKSEDELYEMSETFNHMMDLLEENFEKQQQFASNASHELKTPLTIIESYSSLLKRRGLNEPKLFEESIEAIHSEAVRMREMTDQLLLLARHSGEWDMKIENTNMSSLVMSTAKAFENAYGRELVLEHDGSPIMVATDEQKLKQLLFILLDNARKYSEKPITLSFGVTGKQAFIHVIDKGMGIPKEDLSKVFDRFYRVDKARSRKIGGSGLGLSLAKDIADALDIEIQLQSIYGQGTTASLHLKC
ncbi:histidine kinase [Bacillus sp. FJAT-18017]|uniref:sensor histidine kinase n=1 Tax=Bacillus sp. FJAT-18017 TaxID=1705566 RepID=UPI0006ADBF49|nr:HAMP domain-containing sensor histidine kinase [Bacillus sp. FJAT-18017]ALC91229.1 histidine kinase [Bacillus sp. FJAT-18017]